MAEIKCQGSDLTLLDTIFKDNSPLKTVETIKGILASHNIKTTERWNDSGVEHCYSLRVTIDGTNFGVNGKGLNKEFALASGYGELMERLQLGLFGDSSVQKLGHYSSSIGTDEMLDKAQLLEEMPSWYEYIADEVNKLDKTQKTGADILSGFENSQGKIPSMQCYNLFNGKTVHIPRELCGVLFGSNGGAAGNSIEEAIVQAISEIVERHHKQVAIRERVCLPDIPEEVIEKFSVSYDIITGLRKKGIRVLVKDCSLGTAFPVVCVCFINEKSGKYHTHFGAYPVLEIALERALTESFQGRHLDRFTSFEDFLYNDEDVTSYRSVYKELKKGNFDKSPDFFVGESKYSYNESVGFEGKSNCELLPQLISFFKNQGYELLVYDSSCLGFPTYKVLIPGYSEVVFQSLSQKHNSFGNTKSAIKTLRNPEKAEFVDFMQLLLHMNAMKKLSDLDPRLYSFGTCANLALKCDNNEDNFLICSSLAYAYYAMDNISQASSFLGKAVALANEEEAEYLLCLKRYFAMKLSGQGEKKTRKLLELFHKPKTVEEIYGCLESGKNPFGRFILRCDKEHCDSCRLVDCCRQEYTDELIALISEKSAQINISDMQFALKKYINE